MELSDRRSFSFRWQRSLSFWSYQPCKQRHVIVATSSRRPSLNLRSEIFLGT